MKKCRQIKVIVLPIFHSNNSFIILEVERRNIILILNPFLLFLISKNFSTYFWEQFRNYLFTVKTAQRRILNESFGPKGGANKRTNGAKEIWKLNPSDGQSKHIKAQLVGCVLTKFYFVLITKTFFCFNWWKDFKLTTFIDSINGFGFNFTSLLIFYFRSWTIVYLFTPQ